MERNPSENQKRRKKSQSETNMHEEMEEEEIELFHIVVEDLRLKSTVGWHNATKSLNAALSQIEREESQRFLENAWYKVVNIMLDQHASKIGPIEKSCVVQTLMVSVPLAVAQLKRNRFLQALPVLISVFNKKRTFYKDSRTTGIVGSYWNKVSGSPEVRIQCITCFCELHGFELLLETLERMMKSLLSRPTRSPEEEETEEMVMDSEDIRILLQALLESRHQVSNEVIYGLCIWIMRYFVSISESLLRKESTDAIGAVLSIIRRLVEAEAGAMHAAELDALWLDLTLRYVASTSLPLRLFGLEQIHQIVNAARVSRPLPARYLVRHAGTECVNGVYQRKIDAALATYVMHCKETNQVFTLFWCTMKSGLKMWFISEADKLQPGSDKDIDYYQQKSQVEEYLPPMYQWVATGSGQAPTPQVLPEISHEKEEEETSIQRLDQVFCRWIQEQEIIQALFGDRIHREVVSRSAILIKFLAEVHRLSTTAIEIIWRSCLQKDHLLMDEIHTVMISALPFLSDELVLYLIEMLEGSLRKKMVLNENFPELIAFLQRLATNLPVFLMERSFPVTNAILQLLWRLQLHNQVRLSRDLLEFFQQGLRGPYGETLRRVFLNECMSGIKRSCFLSTETEESTVAIVETNGIASKSLELLQFLMDSYGTELSAIVESLEAEHSMVTLLFDELAAFVSRCTDVSSAEYRLAIGQRLELIHYIHVKSSKLVLSVSQVQRLWKILSSTPMERECCLIFFNQSNVESVSKENEAVETTTASSIMILSSAFTPTVRSYIFNELLCQQTDFTTLGVMGYNCFLTYFLGLNHTSSVDVKRLIGLDALWRIAFDAPLNVSELASHELLRVYGVASTDPEAMQDFVRHVFAQLSVVSNATPTSLTIVQQCMYLLNGIVDKELVRLQELQLTQSPLLTPHGRTGRGAIFSVKVVVQRIPGGGTTSTPSVETSMRTLSATIYSNQTLGELKQALEPLVGHPAIQIKVLCAGIALTGDHKTIADFQITEASELRVLLFNTIPPRSKLSGTNESDHGNEALSIETIAQCYPGWLIAQDGASFEVLFRVLDAVAAHPSVHSMLWGLLKKIPTNRQLLTMVSRISEDGDTLMESNEWTLLDQQGSSHKAIYILQIVDALLLPCDTMKVIQARVFLEHFIACHGFDQVILYFLSTNVCSNAFNEGAAVALRILKYCMFDAVEYVGSSVKVVVRSGDYERLAIKIAELVIAEYQQLQAKSGTTEPPRILLAALKTISSVVGIANDAAPSFVSRLPLRNMVASVLLECEDDSVREHWLVAIQSVCQASGPSTVLVYQQVIDSLGRIEQVKVSCDQYFSLLRYLVQQETLMERCLILANGVVNQLQNGFSSKFLASNEHATEVLTGCLEIIRDVLVHQPLLQAELASKAVQVVYDHCLFTLPSSSDHRRGPLCVSTDTRRPAFKLLATAISACPEIVCELQSKLCRLFTREDLLQLKWGQEHSMETRSRGEFVGLKNQGCSCYINSFLQQIFMHPLLRKGLLVAQVTPRPIPSEPTKAEVVENPQRLVGCRIAVECAVGRVYEANVIGYDALTSRHRLRYDEGGEVSFVLSEGRPANENGRYLILPTELTGVEATLEVLRQVQRTFCYLRDSEMRFFNPKLLVDACKCLNLEFSVYQQNDASEFCDKLLDRLEIGLKHTSQGPQCLVHAFGGKLVSQKLPMDCGHRYEREEPFIRLELQIRGKESIEESLASFVEGELMDGDNRVECELCGTKKAAMRRTCFGALPNFLILHLKRFDLDYTTFETVKLNNRCSFPMTLNMKPYTKVGIESDTVMESSDSEDGMASSIQQTALDPQYEYRLKGILVHSGVAQGGHYYSFIYDKVSEKWFKYDDEDVTPFDPSHIEAECFGGIQRRSWHGSNSNSMEMEVFSNALMLFYEKVVPTDTEYAEALSKDTTPCTYEAEVMKSNEAFLQHSYLFDTEFHEFLREMVVAKYIKEGEERSTHSILPPPSPVRTTNSHSSSRDTVIQSSLAQIGIDFVLSVLLHSREQHGIGRWIEALTDKFDRYKSICIEFFDVLSSTKRTTWLKRMLFESPDPNARQSFVNLVTKALMAYEKHMKYTRDSVDETILVRFLGAIIEYMDQTAVFQQTHLEDCFLLIRNCAETSSVLQKSMRDVDMIARLVNCFLGDRAPAALKAALPSSHTALTSTRFAAPDCQHLLEAIISILGFPCRTIEPIVNETNAHYPHHVTLSEKAERALADVFAEHSDKDGVMEEAALLQYLSMCLHCSCSNPAVEQKARGILAKYGKQEATPSHLELDGFLIYYTDLAANAVKNVYHDLQAFGYGDDLQRHAESDMPMTKAEDSLQGLRRLSQRALLNEVFFDFALEEDAEMVGDMLLRISLGNRATSLMLLKSLLHCMNTAETGWKGQPTIDVCTRIVSQLLAFEGEYQNELIELAMLSPDYGWIATADAREKSRQRYVNSNHVPLFIYRQIVVLLEIQTNVVKVAEWLKIHQSQWQWMYEWLRLESLQPSLGGRLSVLIRESSKLETLCRLGEVLGIPYRPEERVFSVENAGYEHVNGLYKSSPGQIYDNCVIYSCIKPDIEYTLFRCCMPSKARRWYISYSPNKSLLGTVSDEDYYFAPCHIDDDSPPETGWKVWSKNEKALPPLPTVRLYSCTVSSINHPTNLSEDFGEVDGMEGDGDTVDYDDSEDEIRVSNERFQAVHLNNQEDGDSLGTSEDFM